MLELHVIRDSKHGPIAVQNIFTRSKYEGASYTKALRFTI